MKTKIPNIRPAFQAGDNVLVKWSNNQIYTGVIRRKLRKNWGVEIKDKNWFHSSNKASVPAFAISKRCH